MFRVFVQKRKRRLSSPRIVALSVGVHLILANAVLLASTGPAEPAKPEETYTEFPLTPVPPKPPTPETPAPEQPRESVVPRVAGKTLELPAPTRVPDHIPEADPNAQPVSDSQFTGIGAPGNVIGTPAGDPAPPSAGVPQGDPAPDGNFVYEPDMVEERPAMANLPEVARLLERNYPRSFADAGVAGRVMLEMVVDETGRVRPGSVRVVSTSDEAFSAPSMRVAERIRFRPARVGDRAVPVMVVLPIEWKPESR